MDTILSPTFWMSLEYTWHRIGCRAWQQNHHAHAPCRKWRLYLSSFQSWGQATTGRHHSQNHTEGRMLGLRLTLANVQPGYSSAHAFSVPQTKYLSLSHRPTQLAQRCCLVVGGGCQDTVTEIAIPLGAAIFS